MREDRALHEHRPERRLIVLGFALFWASSIILQTLGCATGRAPTHGSRVPARSKQSDGVGLASYYHDALIGRRTANGERYDPTRLTCAHRSLSFGTRVSVTVRRTGARAVCRVNDRGPYVKGRIIDLSRAMARELGIEHVGVAEVEIHRE